METKRIWRRELEEKRVERRVPADFYAVELSEGARYLRKVIERFGAMASSSKALARRRTARADGRSRAAAPLEGEEPLRVQGEVAFYVKDDGKVGEDSRDASAPLPVRRARRSAKAL